MILFFSIFVLAANRIIRDIQQDYLWDKRQRVGTFLVCAWTARALRDVVG